MVLKKIEKSKFAQINDKRDFAILLTELFFHYYFLIHICMESFNIKETKNRKLNRFY